MKKLEPILPTFESMPQLHGATGMPLRIIREAKQAGCDAFVSGNRIRLGPLLKWFFAEFDDTPDRPPDGLPTWREALNRAQTKREEMRLSVEAKEVIPISEAHSQAAQAMGAVFAGLSRMAGELPPVFESMNANQIAMRFNTAIELLRAELKHAFAQIAGDVDVQSEAFKAGEQAVRREFFAAVRRIAFEQNIANEYDRFLEWRRQDEAERGAKRRAWCKERAAVGLPVPDATAEELAKFPGLKRQ